jgi:hypothetical protein
VELCNSQIAAASPLSLWERVRVRAVWQEAFAISRCISRRPHPRPLSGHRPKVGRERGDVPKHALTPILNLHTFLRLLPFVFLIFCAGCRDSAKAPPPTTAPGNAATSSQHQTELLAFVVANLNRLEEFDSSDAVEKLLHRLDPKNTEDASSSTRPDPVLAAWPQPEMLREIVDRLNQWIGTQQASADWKADPMVAALPQAKDLDGATFSGFDGFFLQEAVWLRDISRWGSGDALDDLERAKSLFDWTIRNIQIEPDNPKRIPKFPWETLLLGRGTASERAWVFILLTRQLGIEAAVLAPNAAKAEKDATTRPWCVAVLVENNAYLFDPTLGLPIPAPKGVTADESGRLAIQPATLAQAADDEKVLRRLDANEKNAYPLSAADLKHVAIMLEASPAYLARRMQLFESKLAGAEKMVLSTHPSAQAERWKAVAGVDDVRLWQLPFDTLERRSRLSRDEVLAQLAALLPFYAMPAAPLYRGRVLQLKGRFTGDDGAIHFYQLARPSTEAITTSYMAEVEKVVQLRAKQDASYWLGLIAYQRQSYPAAIDYFTKRTLLFAPDGPWTVGARYNLGRTFEAAGERERAILQYNSNANSPGYLGDLLRAKWLAEKAARAER